MKNIFILFLISLSVFLIGCKDDEETDAKDYMPFTTSGYLYHWTPNTTIRIKVPACTATLAAPDCPAYVEQAVKDGINLWKDTLAARGVTINIITTGNNDVLVKWDNGSGVDPGVLGFAQIKFSENPSRTFTMTTKNNTTGIAHSETLIKFIATHEFGHMLGIWNHSFEEQDIMYPYASGPNALTNRDKETMKYLYGFTPDRDLSGLPTQTLTSPVRAASHQIPAGYENAVIKEVFTLPGYGGNHIYFEPPTQEPINPDLDY